MAEAHRGRFQKGQHWRPRKPHWDRAWLAHEYIEKQRSASDIAIEEGCTENAILFWLAKHNIPRRSMSETRRIKHWMVCGPKNGMYGRTGSQSPAWKGGSTPQRQAFYSSPQWATAIKAVWARDKGICQRCRKKNQWRGIFHIHHRIHFGIHELRSNIENLILLCGTCHHWVHSKANRQKLFVGAFQPSLKGGVTNGGESMEQRSHQSLAG